MQIVEAFTYEMTFELSVEEGLGVGFSKRNKTLLTPLTPIALGVKNGSLLDLGASSSLVCSINPYQDSV